MITKLTRYLNEALGEEFALKKATGVQNKLPYALSPRYSVYVSEIFGHKVHFAIDNDTTTPSGYEKESSLIRKIAGTPVVLAMENSTPVDVHRLIRKRIDFVVPGKRMFMPTLLIDLGGRYASEEALPDIIPPLAQLIILFQVQKGNLNGLDANTIAGKFGATYLTASRALKWLGEKIAPLKNDGRKLVLNFPANDALLNAAKSYLRNPVIKIIRTDEPVDGIGGVIAGESALEEYSMLVANGECRAVGKDAEISVCQDTRGVNSIEKWMYNPEFLANGSICDKMSLILSMADNPDERVHKDIEKLKETAI